MHMQILKRAQRKINFNTGRPRRLQRKRIGENEIYKNVLEEEN